MKLSLVIPAKDANDQKLAELLRSIDAQDFPKEEMETLVITEGTSESAKAIGIRRAKGEVIGILASDNELIEKNTLSRCSFLADIQGAAYPWRYYYNKKDNILNRYFALMGGNDPIVYYLDKYDRIPYHIEIDGTWKVFGRTLGDNGFFVRKDLIEKTDLDNYYHIDNANEIDIFEPLLTDQHIWHKTGSNFFSFFAKRYRYGLQHAFNSNRRWHLVDFRQSRDVWRLILFGFFSLTLIQPLYISIRGYLKIRDMAWFIHPLACLMTVFTYGLLVLHLSVRNLLSLLSSAPMAARRA